MQADGLFIVRALKVETVAVQMKALDALAATGETEPVGVRRKRRLNVTLQIDLIEFTPTGKPNAGRE